MSPLDQDATLASGARPTGAMAYADYGAGVSQHNELGYEPELEGSSYQTAPITSLAISRWTWAVAGLLIGAILGFLSATGGGWKSTALLQIDQASIDPNGMKAYAQTLQVMATSDAVLAEAVRTLRASNEFKAAGGKLPANVNDAKAEIAGSVSAVWQQDTTLVNITSRDTNGILAIYKATAAANAVKTKLSNDAEQAIQDTITEAKTLASQTAGPSGSALEDARLRQIGDMAGTKQSTAGFTAKSQTTVIPATVAVADGPDPTVSALLGAAGGAFLGALAAVAAGAGRRKPHSPRELMSLAPDLTVRTTVQAGELAGRILETDRRSVVVLAMPDTRFAATQLAMAIAHHLRTHGATVAVVDRVSEFSPSTASEDRLWALRRDVRRNVPANFSADMLVVVCGADEEALSLIAGQSDLLVAVVAKQRKTILADIRRTVDAVRVSEPVVVLAR
jgi:hypothetical protein